MSLIAAQPLRSCLPNRRLLLLQNPGRGSRNYLNGILRALEKQGVAHCVLELQEIWDSSKTDPAGLVRRMSQMLVDQHIGAVFSYGFNGMADMPIDAGPLPAMRSFFEVRNIPHLMLWIDHPQWHSELLGLSPHLQGMLRSSNCVHFLKSAAHAMELERFLGWPNCHALFPGVDPDQFPVKLQDKPPYDLVAICTDGGPLPDWLKEFLPLENPNPQAIRNVILTQVRASLSKLWKDEVPDGIRPEVIALGEKWSGLKSQHPFVASVRHWPALLEQFPGAAWYLTMAYPTYMAATRILWRLREWERRFYLAYLAQYFRVGVVGGDLSPIGVGPGGWIDYLQQSEFYGQGRVALNINDGHDEEGLTLKPFEIAASGVAMLHYQAQGLSDCFDDGTEVAVFSSPLQARQKLDELLDNPTLRTNMALAARKRTLHQHTWEHRLVEMFRAARLPMDHFRVSGQMAPAFAGSQVAAR